MNRRLIAYQGGERFGRLTVVQKAGNASSGAAMWECRCDCGNVLAVRGACLRNGGVKSCGCLHREVGAHQQRIVLSRMATRHGMYKTAEYKTWAAIKDRCSNPKNKDFAIYGGAGVVVHDEWTDSFEAFFEYMGLRPTPKHSIDRYPNRSGSYEPGNVRWATPIEQANNKRNTRKLTYRGQEMTWAEAYRASGCSAPYQTFCSRMGLGWSPERALS